MVIAPQWEMMSEFPTSGPPRARATIHSTVASHNKWHHTTDRTASRRRGNVGQRLSLTKATPCAWSTRINPLLHR
jgi:hypothetical protein